MNGLMFGWTTCPNCSCRNPLTVKWRFFKMKRTRCNCCKKAFWFAKEDVQEEKVEIDKPIASDSKIKSIKCVEVRQFYDSVWDIELKSGEICRIVRDDLETEEELRSIIEKCDSADEIVAVLDMRDKIYYD